MRYFKDILKYFFTILFFSGRWNFNFPALASSLVENAGQHAGHEEFPRVKSGDLESFGIRDNFSNTKLSQQIYCNTHGIFKLSNQN